MAKGRGPQPHKFRNKLVLNQWLISLFGIDPLAEHRVNGKKVRPFHKLAEPIRDPRMEGLDESNIHRFFHNLVSGLLFDNLPLDKMQVLRYEENIVRHTQRINERRDRKVTWKYFQWLTLLFTEIYLDKLFNNREGLLTALNEFVDRFNGHWSTYADVPQYTDNDLNKLCYQNATGSGKTLIMHVNLLQYQHYAERAGRADELSRVILLTPNERLSEQHLGELAESDIAAEWFVGGRNTLFTVQAGGLRRVDVMEITKLADKDGPQQIATRSLGDENLLLVDEGHRGMSGKEEGKWFSRRNALCDKGFTSEYSATFEQAVAAAKNETIENAYAKCILFDYSYRYFYEDGFGKDYQILNLPRSFDDVVATYLTACLLKFYQQLRVYEERGVDLKPFNIEKPLWVFVGSSVQKAGGTKDEKEVASDVARVLQFIADFLSGPAPATERINRIITGTGEDTGLLDQDGNDIFSGSFAFLAKQMNAGETVEQLYQDILQRLFNNPAGGTLALERIKGESGEVVLKCGNADEPFGLINVGDAKGLCDHVKKVAGEQGTVLEVEDSDFSEAMFATVRESTSPINLLIGSKKFVEGWDCWRVSTMGLMHVGKSEGSQIIQLFGRGVRLKGFEWSLKRSGHTFAPNRPNYIEELETLNVFGIEADFMERFREFLKEEGLPGNEKKQTFTIPLNVTHDFGKRLKILRPKRSAADGREYDFKRDAPVPMIGDIPEYMKRNRVVSDWYPRIQAVRSRGEAEAGDKHEATLRDIHLAFLDYDALYFEMELFKRQRTWYNLNITKEGIRRVLSDPSWYLLKIPSARMEPSGYDNVRLWQEVAAELVKRYCDHFYNYRKSEFIEPRLELRELTADDDNFPEESEYHLVVDGNEEQVIQSIQQIKTEIARRRDELLQVGDLCACTFGRHLYQPLLHVRRGGKIKITPVALNESEYQFVGDLKKFCDANKREFEQDGVELFLLRNMSRGRGVGFFEAEGFHPDFILWILTGERQYITFAEPHGLLHEGPGSKKVQFHKKIKEVETRLNDPDIVLNSFILSWTRHAQLRWGVSIEQLEEEHVLFMTEDREGYVEKMIGRIRGDAPAAAM
jgi:hypothetical protein